MASTALQSQFQYKPIGKDDIRLLKWPRKRPRKDSDDIHLSLVAMPRSEAPKYTALSYEWTQQAATKPIYIDKQCFLVRPNLYSGLERLRERRGFWEYLWIDALCIDQGNVSERNDQVQQMASTYRDAWTVVAWLGNDTRLDRKHWRLRSVYTPAELKFFAKPMDEADAMKMHGSPSGEVLRLGLRQRRKFEPTPARRGHAIKILDLSYWTRRWVAPELHLSRRLDFLWGAFSFTWDDICLLVEKYTHSVPLDEGLHTSSEANDRTWFIGKRHSARVFLDTNLFGVSERNGRSTSLGDCLGFHREAVCSDPRDVIFAFLGVLSQEERRVFENFFPDYTLKFCLVALIVCSYLKQTDWRSHFGADIPVRDQRENARDMASHLGLSIENLALCFEISEIYEISEFTIDIRTCGLEDYRQNSLDDFEDSKLQWGDEKLLQWDNTHVIMMIWRIRMIKFLAKLAQDFAGYDWPDLKAWLAGQTPNTSERHQVWKEAFAENEDDD